MADVEGGGGGAQDMEAQIKAAIESRVSHFQDQAHSLTMERVRRLLEKDLGLETHALDTHKPLIKLYLHSLLEGDTEEPPKIDHDAGDNAAALKVEVEPLDDVQVKKESEPHSDDGDKMEDSPVMGLMTAPRGVKSDPGSVEDSNIKVILNEMTIKKALSAKASYIIENAATITLAGLRRLLEEDLELEKKALDPFKTLIKELVDEVLQSPPEVPQTTASVKKKKVNKEDRAKVVPKSVKKEQPASGSESDEPQEDEIKLKTKTAPKRKPQKPEAVKKRKKDEEDAEGAKKKKGKVARSPSERSDDGGDVSEDGSEASTEKPVKKKQISKPSHGKQVERLKSVIKSCGMSVPPSIYKKVKQAPESKQESCLIKELEQILAKEGLSPNPSEKEIKDVKKRKDRARELEGIDMSNIIVSSSRRRSTTSFVPPPKPKIPDISESESEDSENEDEEDEEDEEVADEEVGDDQENGGDSGESEESAGNADSE